MVAIFIIKESAKLKYEINSVDGSVIDYHVELSSLNEYEPDLLFRIPSKYMVFNNKREFQVKLLLSTTMPKGIAIPLDIRDELIINISRRKMDTASKFFKEKEPNIFLGYLGGFGNRFGLPLYKHPEFESGVNSYYLLGAYSSELIHTLFLYCPTSNVSRRLIRCKMVSVFPGNIWAEVSIPEMFVRYWADIKDSIQFNLVNWQVGNTIEDKRY
jgi:hypothetical protein